LNHTHKRNKIYLHSHQIQACIISS